MAKVGRKPIVDKHDYRFSVPGADSDVIAWIEAQENLGVSLRTIIKQSVQKDGIVDAFCKAIPNPGVSAGRPKATESVQTHVTNTPKTETKSVAKAAEPAETVETEDAGNPINLSSIL